MTTSPLAVACAIAARDGDVPTLCRLLALANDPAALAELWDDGETETFSAVGRGLNRFRGLFGKRRPAVLPSQERDIVPEEDVEVLDDDMFLPWAEDIPEPESLPIAHELTPTEEVVYNNNVIHARSSWIEEWHYDGPNHVLYVLAKGPKSRGYMGKEYPLGKVPFGLVMEFYYALSPGRFFNDNFKGQFPSGGPITYKKTSPGSNIVTKLD